MYYISKIPTHFYASPFCEKMTSNYYQKVIIEGIRGIEDYFMTEVLYPLPYADAWALHPVARRLDFLSGVFLRNSWLVTEQVLHFLQGFNLPSYHVLDAWVEHKKKRYPYKIVHFTDNYLKAVDFNKTTCYLYNAVKISVVEKVSVYNVEDYKVKNSMQDIGTCIMANKLYLLDDMPNEVDVFRLRHISNRLFFSERLKNAIETTGFTGIAFEAVGAYLNNNLRWADTGLPVQD